MAKGAVKPETKAWGTAIRMEAMREVLYNGKPTKHMHKLARILFEKAAEGDVTALKEIGDRMDGKPRQEVETEHKGILAITKIEDVIVDPKDSGS